MTNYRQTTHDHPTQVLNQYAADAYSRGDAAYGEKYSTAATRLFGYEIENDVTFAALDNDALAEVRSAYAAFNAASSADDRVDALLDLRASVCDLLGLGDL